MASFPTYLAGLQTGFIRVTEFIALKNNPLLKLIFQNGDTLKEIFYIGHSRFALYQHLPHIYVCRYVVSRGGLQYRISFLGIDTDVEIGTGSNVDLVHFVWRHCKEMYTFWKHAITFLYYRDGFVQRLLCLRQYDIPSAGWFFASGSPICMGLARAQVRCLTGCLAPVEACNSTICTRQPPSLRDLAFQSYYTLVLISSDLN